MRVPSRSRRPLPTISKIPDGPGFAKVTVALPPSLAAGNKLFARLKVAVVTP